MIERATVFVAKGHNSHRNLALEALLTESMPAGEAGLMLWQNDNAVIIGAGQNAWRECDIAAMERDHVALARRPSGGGAVFHDLGNLNFTFVAPSGDYNVSRQLEVICRAVKTFGLDAQKNGRNDITIDGKKFSGNAFQKSKGISCHHGTLLVHVDTEQMARYLTASAKKLQAKGVSSVKSRVVNLQSLCPSITVDSLSDALFHAFEETYGLTAQILPSESVDWEEVRKISASFASWQWRLGREIPFSFELADRFSWGEIQLRFEINSGKIIDVQIYSDAMDTDFIEKLPSYLRDLPFSFSLVADAL